jgi:hypothetical protein
MRNALNSSRNPADASIDAVLPGVHDRLAALQNSVETTRTTLTDRMMTMCSDLKDHVDELNKSSRLELAAQFATVAVNLVEGQHGRKAEREAPLLGTLGRQEEEEEHSDLARVSGHRMSHSPGSITSLYNEYYGLEFYEGVPIEGGIAEVEKIYKNKWRKNYIGGELMHFSRIQRIIKAVNDKVKGGTELCKVLEEYDGLFNDEQKSLSRMIAALKVKGGIITFCRSKRDAAGSAP